MDRNERVWEFKSLRTLHDSGFRNIQIKNPDGSITEGHDVIHVTVGNIWINIDCDKKGVYRLFIWGTREIEDDMGMFSSYEIKVKS